MKREIGGALGMVIILLLSFAELVPAEAQSLDGQDLAAVEVHAGLVAFRPSAGESLTLTIDGTSFRYQEHFRAGQTPAFAPVDRKGFVLPDGVYVWELAATAQLPVTRVAGQGTPANGRAIHRAPVLPRPSQSGAFSIVNGRLVDPTLVEEGAGPAVAKPTSVAIETGSTVHYHDSDALNADGRE